MSNTISKYWYSPVGWLHIQACDYGVTAIDFVSEPSSKKLQTSPNISGNASAHVEQLSSELEAYFARNLRVFKTPVYCTHGTPFQQKVWQALQVIPYGVTWSYKELAGHIGSPQASRAVGNANGKNPIPILVPCHRVIAHSGALGGYSSGLHIKTQLLALEKSW